MPHFSPNPCTPDTAWTTQVEDDVGSCELTRYRQACQEVDRLLDQGRLFEARRLNDETRTLFRSLFSAGRLG